MCSPYRSPPQQISWLYSHTLSSRLSQPLPALCRQSAASPHLLVVQFPFQKVQPASLGMLKARTQLSRFGGCLSGLVRGQFTLHLYARVLCLARSLRASRPSVCVHAKNSSVMVCTEDNTHPVTTRESISSLVCHFDRTPSLLRQTPTLQPHGCCTFGLHILWCAPPESAR